MGRSDSIVFFDKYIALSQIFVNLQICSNKTMIQSQPYKFFPEFVEVFCQSLTLFKKNWRMKKIHLYAYR